MQNKETELLNKIKTIVAEQLGIDESEIEPESNFVEDLGADSLDIVELIMSLEEELGVEISDEDGEKMSTVVDVYSFMIDRIDDVVF